MKKILFLLLLTVASYGQTYQNPTFGTITSKTSPTVTSPVNLVTQDANGMQGKSSNVVNKINSSGNSGIITFDGLAINADPTKFNLGAGTGYITNSLTGVTTAVSWSAQTAQTTPYLATSVATYVLKDSSGATVLQNSYPTNEQFRTHIYLGKLAHTTFTTITVVVNDPGRSFSVAGDFHDFVNSIGSINIEGNAITPNGANLNINVSAGRTYREGANFMTNRNSPNITNEPAVNATTFRNKFRNGSGGWSAVNTTTVDPNNYDDGSGILQLVPNNKFTIRVVYRFGGSGVIHMDYGQAVYDDMAAADAGIANAVISDPDTKGFASRIGWIIIKQGTTSLLDATKYKFVAADLFGTRAATSAPVATLQTSYDASVTPQIVTNATGGAVAIRRGSAADSDNILVGQNGAGTNTFSVTGAGVVNFSNKQNNLTTDGTGVKIPTVDAVNNEKQVKKIVYEGDSLTDTSGAGYPTNYPSQIPDYNFDIARAIQVNVATAGDQVQTFISGGQYTSQVQPHKPSSNKEKVIFSFMMGTNDLAAGRTPAQVYNDLKTVWAQAKSDGFIVVAFCITRSGISIRDTGALVVNEAIISDPTLYDYVVRTDLILPNPSDTFYFQVDQLHLTAEGSKKVAKELNRVLVSQINNYSNSETSLPILQGNVSIGLSNAATNSKLHVKGLGVSASANSGTVQNSGFISRFQGSTNAALDFGSNSGTGLWLQSLDSSDLSASLPLLFNPNGGKVIFGSNSSLSGDIYQFNNSVYSSSSIKAVGVINSGSGVNNVALNNGNIDYYNASAADKYIRLQDDSNTINAIRFSKSGSNPIIELYGTPTAPTAAAGTNTTQIATTAFVQTATSAVRPYLVYTALLTQSGTSAPTATVLENTLGGTVVWTRSSTGIYLGTLSGVFTNNKTSVSITNGSSGAKIIGAYSDTTSTITVGTVNSSTSASEDDVLFKATIEIRVYP